MRIYNSITGRFTYIIDLASPDSYAHPSGTRDVELDNGEESAIRAAIYWTDFFDDEEEFTLFELAHLRRYLTQLAAQYIEMTLPAEGQRAINIMLRRIERKLAKAIVAGQEEGTVRSRTNQAKDLIQIQDLITPTEARNNGSNSSIGILNMADGTDEDFEEALIIGSQTGAVSRVQIWHAMTGTEPTDRSKNDRPEAFRRRPRRKIDATDVIMGMHFTLDGLVTSLDQVEITPASVDLQRLYDEGVLESIEDAIRKIKRAIKPLNLEKI